MTRYRLDGVISTADAKLASNTMNKHEEAVKQAAVADRIVITKIDLAEKDEISDLESRLKGLNPAARIYHTEHGEIHPDLLFDAGLYDPKTKSLDVQRWLRAEAYAEKHDHHQHAHSKKYQKCIF